MTRPSPLPVRLAGLVLLASACAAPEAPAPSYRVPRFTDVTPAMLPKGLPAPIPGYAENLTHALFADVDSDGRDELVLSHEEVPSGTYAWSGGAWAPWPSNIPPLPKGPLAFADLDGDGHPDLLRSTEVAWNRGDGRFEEQTRFPELSWGRASNMTAADLDSDGWLDMLGGGVCCGNPACHDLGIALRTGPRAFRILDASSGLHPGPWLKSYLAAWVPMDPEPLLVQLGQPCTTIEDGASPFYRIERDADGWPRFTTVEPLPRDAVFRLGMPTRALPIQSPMGAVADDFDLDGRIDFALATNPYQELFRGGEAWPMQALGGSTGILRTPGPSLFQIPWAMHALDLDLDGRPDLVVAHGDDGEARTNPAYYVGPQQVGIYLNQGPFKFVDVTLAAGMPAGQWRSIAVGDFDCDGDPDLGLGAIDDWPRILRNDTDDAAHAISLRFKGTNSNRLGLGARVEVWPDGATEPRRYVVGGPAVPGSFSEPMVFAALTPASHAARVRVTWPSGLVQEVTQLLGGRCHVIEEPRVFNITPSTRHVTAGKSVTIVVTPRDAAGANRAATLEGRVAYGEARLQSKPVPAGLEFTLTRDTPGSAVFEAVIDGVPMPVRPRIWWDAETP